MGRCRRPVLQRQGSRTQKFQNSQPVHVKPKSISLPVHGQASSFKFMLKFSVLPCREFSCSLKCMCLPFCLCWYLCLFSLSSLLSSIQLIPEVQNLAELSLPPDNAQRFQGHGRKSLLAISTFDLTLGALLRPDRERLRLKPFTPRLCPHHRPWERNCPEWGMTKFRLVGFFFCCL